MKSIAPVFWLSGIIQYKPALQEMYETHVTVYLDTYLHVFKPIDGKTSQIKDTLFVLFKGHLYLVEVENYD